MSDSPSIPGPGAPILRSPTPAEARSLDLLETNGLGRHGADEGPLTVELVSDGRLRAPRESTRQLLRERLRRAEVMRTGRGWTLLRTLDSPPMVAEEDEEGEIIMAGAVGSSIALIDIIGFLATGLQSGMLSVGLGDVQRAISLHRGDLVWAVSNAPEEQIGEFLARRGKITREQLATALKDSPKQPGQACVARGFIAAHDLWQVVQALHTEVFDQLMGMQAGLWTFSRLSEESLSAAPTHMPTQRLLMDALRKVDEMRVYREVIPSADELVHRTSGFAGSPVDAVRYVRPDIAETAAGLLSHVTAPVSIRELMKRCGKGEFDVTCLVYHLYKAKLVDLSPAERPGLSGRPSGATISKTRSSDVIGIYSMAIREMFDELARKGQAEVLQSAAAAFLTDQNADTPALLRSVRLLHDGSIDQATLQAAINATPTTLSGLCQALDELLFFLLFQATELVGRRRRDDLARRVKMIHGMLSKTEGRPSSP